MWRSQRGSLNPGSFIFYAIPTTGSSFTSVPQVSSLSNGLPGVTSAFCATFAYAESVNSASHQPESLNVAVPFPYFLLRQRHCKPGDSHVFVIHWPATIGAPVFCVKSRRGRSDETDGNREEPLCTSQTPDHPPQIKLEMFLLVGRKEPSWLAHALAKVWSKLLACIQRRAMWQQHKTTKEVLETKEVPMVLSFALSDC